ncbi:aminotransferase class I/II-fold pyridoxal phosphate-dependent enzyme [Paenibacillus roseipurpureus]|uniref:Aminotransferase class V-fold PLP-dependent enzyme n=1 Tax=Paenibacillus roseopurpureus TaxID=2918901 RepID=A0AA96LP76_9BACL|nr:aminotransferase class I/II-fold pyridoxal phosphate-dependent enzyme [Paenibacillus sp. MBLB1832]WNR44746.1 aminotransferase class V-fold PLP-dependent enzyme [Paenibacillus sp. MBLB1832]
MRNLHIDKARAPLYEAMVAHQAKHSVSLHVPGHKSGQGLQDDGKRFLITVMSIDYTEITGLDDLHHAEGAILEAQELAADCFGAEETYFLVGGSTVGNIAMIGAVCGKGDLILVQRNAHKSVIHGLMFAGAKAIFIAPRIDAATGVATGLHIEDVKQALALYPTAKALFLTNPNYYGMGVDVKLFADEMHDHGKLLLVDEAHGAHFGFHEDVPASALSQGADAVVQSTHKMLTALTMGAMLHVQGPRVNRGALKQMLAMLQSSSPSYPILASLDLARKRVHTEGRTWLDQGIQLMKEFRAGLDDIAFFRYCPQRITHEKAYETADPFKIAIYDPSFQLTGSELKDQLEAQGCYVEMTDGYLVLLVFSAASTREDVHRTLAALHNICLDIKVRKQELQAPISNIMKLPTYVTIGTPVGFDHRRVNQEEITQVSVEEAIGKRSSDMVIPYPPGVPLLYPGETITASIAEALVYLADQGIRFHGTHFGQTHKLNIYTDHEIIS